MASVRYGAVLTSVGRLFGRGTVSGLGEGQLLQRFAAERDEAAFEALVAGLGPMVLGVCRRVLDDPHDVEDAFQATFLVLVRRARAIRDGDKLGAWLHGVALKVALRARARAARRRDHERTGVEAEPMAMAPAGKGEDREIRAALDEEIARLPEKFRSPVVLCYLEGLTHDQAAQKLRCPVGTVRSRMATARERLRTRLARRGFPLAATLPRPPAVPSEFLHATVKAAVGLSAGKMAAGVVSAGALVLAREVVMSMFVGKLKVLSAVVLGAGLVTAGAGGLARSAAQDHLGNETQPAESAAEKPSRRAEAQAPVPESVLLRDLRKQIERHNELREQVERLDRQVTALVEELRGSKPQPPEPSQVKKPESPKERINRFEEAVKKAETGAPAVKSTIPIIMENNRMIVAFTPERDRFRVFSKIAGTWSSYQTPKGVKGAPVFDAVSTPTGVANAQQTVSRGMALVLRGQEISQVAVYDSVTGEWSTHEVVPFADERALAPARDFIPFGRGRTGFGGPAAAHPRQPGSHVEGTEGMFAPNVSKDAVYYALGNRVFAYSFHAKKWDIAEFAPGGSPDSIPTPFGPAFQDGSSLKVFDIRDGRWKPLDWESIEKMSAEEMKKFLQGGLGGMGGGGMR